MRVINFILFQLAWFSCVIGAAKGMPWLGVVVTLAIVTWHLTQAKAIKPEATLILSALAIGTSYDQILLSLNLVTYVHHGWDVAFVPVWILALWVAFSTILNVSLRWMRGKHLIAIVFGAIGGPLAYLGAEKLGAVTLYGTSSYIALSIGWAIITPLLLLISTRLDGFKPLNQAMTLKDS
jgi:hypothetical protein